MIMPGGSDPRPTRSTRPTGPTGQNREVINADDPRSEADTREKLRRQSITLNILRGVGLIARKVITGTKITDEYRERQQQNQND